MNDSEMKALSRVLSYLDACVEETSSPETAIRYDSIVLHDWLNYQIDMTAETRVGNDAKRAAANEYAKERN